MYNKFSAKFKREKVNQYAKGESVIALCKKHNIPRSTMYSWIRRYKKIRVGKNNIISARELDILNKKVKRLEDDNAILQECGCTVQSKLKDKLNAIEKLDGEYSIHSLCRALKVRRSTYYHRKFRSPEITQSQKIDNILKPVIKQIFDDSKGRLGVMKICVLLSEQGMKTSAKRVSRLMKEMNLVSVYNKKYITYNFVKFAMYNKDLVKREYMRTKPNEVWVSDITYIYVNYKPYYLCVIIDLFSRKVISYKVSSSMKTTLVIQTLVKAYESRNPDLGLKFHSDQGCQYTSYDFKHELNQWRIIQSFSNPGCPYDNAVAESFFRYLKKEEVHRWYYRDCEEMRQSIAEYMDFYNNRRPHQTLKYKTPEQVEYDYYSK